jgi:LacI family transcriptional regulator
MPGCENSGMPERSVSMDDVARHVGLSRTTVSFVINGRMDIQISEKSRQRIWDAVDELGYRPNAGARSLATQRTNLIGLITDITSSPFGGGIIHGAQQAAWELGKLMLIVSSEGDPAVESSALEILLGRRIEGVIFATQSHRRIVLPASASEIPTVLVHCFDDAHAFPSVLPDEIAGGYAGTRRLIEAGHKRIALINLDPGLPATVGRQAGYARALEEAGIVIDPRLTATGHATATGGFQAAGDLLDLDQPPTAIFCGTDRMAMGAYDAIKERGLRIPDDIAVVGYDNQEIIAAFLRPPLTTVALPFDAMGAAAVRMLADLVTGPRPQHLTVAGPLIERDSV